MKIRLEKQHATALLEQFPELDSIQQQLRFANKAELAISDLSLDQLKFLTERYQQLGETYKGQTAQLITLLQARENDDGIRYTADDLEQLVPAIAGFLVENAIRGWMFQANVVGKPLAYVVTRLDFTPPGEEETGRILIELKANSRARLATKNIMLLSRDINGKTLTEILLDKGYFKENPALIAAYDETIENYIDWRARYGQQFSAQGIGFFAEDPTASHRNTDWSRKDVVVLSSSGEKARLVNDESILNERTLSMDAKGDILSRYLRKAAKSARYDEKAEDAAEQTQATIPKGLFTELPIHAYVLMFHLELHHHLWVHVDDMQPYVYQPELKQKLILRQEQTDLIDILTAEMDVLMDDIVAGKSGGTTVLCAGPAGVGKTLTAEVYSEIIQRPLYRVHSGQLGLNVAAMEEALKEVLTRAQRWGAIMLIDEADVYIKKRQDDLTMNAVVGVFLRVLEYFNGLLFLTTNRVDDIDEAIISRCIAMIKYYPPDDQARLKIWEVMAEQFRLPLDTTVIEQLVTLFPHATGRDIKGLTKLVAKFCHYKNARPDIATFKRCSVFRGIDINENS